MKQETETHVTYYGGSDGDSNPPNSARVVTVSGRRLELVESPALLS
jgi:hypothetical protein